MWLMTVDGFISVVAHRTEEGCLLVRARKRSHLEGLFPGWEEEVIYTPSADYPYRLTIPTDVFMEQIIERVYSIRYDNFKKAVEDKGAEAWYVECLHDVWSTFREYTWVGRRGK